MKQHTLSHCRLKDHSILVHSYEVNGCMVDILRSKNCVRDQFYLVEAGWDLLPTTTRIAPLAHAVKFDTYVNFIFWQPEGIEATELDRLEAMDYILRWDA